MSTAAQIEANRQNAQLSSGPTSPAGKQRSSMNAVRHGFTGQQVVVSADEKAAYETHCIAFLEQFQPKTHEETELTQQYADQQWSLHQINVQLMNVLSMLNAATAHHVKAGSDFETLNAATAPFYKQIGTLGTYELRRRRAATDTLARFKELAAAREKALAEAAQIRKSLKAQNKIFNPAEFGFVCSSAEIEVFLARQSLISEARSFQNSNKK
jgi:hypothetical protein